MGRIDRIRARRAAERDVRIGWIAGAALAVLQFLALANLLAHSPAPLSWLSAYATGRCVLTAVLVFNVYRRRDWAAAMLLGLLAIDVAVSWTLIGRTVSPVSVLSLVLAYGLYRGVRGTEALASQRSEAPRRPA